jgi:hydroxymethylpyrimidine/phosphomethylpyrimidine kinase
MQKLPERLCALTVAGSDSGGGAGVQADLKTFAAHGVHGVSAITCLSAQNPETVLGVHPCSPKQLARQLEAIEPFKPKAMKTGMLFSKALIEIVVQFAIEHPRIRLVVDPVMIATSGSALLKPSAISALKKLLPHASVITPNAPEAEALSGETVRDIEDQRRVARTLFERFGCAVLVKGGHLKGAGDVADIFYDGDDEYLLTAPKIRGVSAHGTGCTLSAAIAANLALGDSLEDAVADAKEFITGAIANSTRTAAFQVLNSFWQQSGRVA